MDTYLQLTTACNMSCGHCIFGCAAHKKGEYMSRETFNNALAMMEGDYITFGGGEPTMHPQFWEFFGKVMAQEHTHLWMATNGKKKDITLALAGIADGHHRFDMALSRDIWHDPIDSEVVTRFEASTELEVRSIEKIVHAGSAAENGVASYTYEHGCDCADLLFVKPSGDVSLCACLESPVIGNVNTHDYAELTDIAHDLCELAEDPEGWDLGCWRNWDEAQLNYLTEGGIHVSRTTTQANAA